MHPPETRYARLGDVSIAYQVLGRGPDLIMVPMFVGHLDLMWTDPGAARFLRHVASFSRLILFDMPGTGLSDRVSRMLTLEERVRAIGAVLDAVGSTSAAVAGFSEGGQASMLFAATHPERTHALILYGTYPKWPSDRELPELLSEMGEDVKAARVSQLASGLDQVERTLDDIADHWGEGRSLELIAGASRSQLERRFWAVFERAAASPSTARAMLRPLKGFDVTEILPTISVPTLVFQPTFDAVVPPEAGRYLAHKIPGAKLIELPGAHHGFMFSDVVMIAAEVERFLTGRSHAWNPYRTFAAVLFTDMVASTERAAELGDERWRGLLERHDALVHERVDANDGRVVKHTGDGFLIVFEGPTAAICCGEAICDAANELGIQVRAGIHSGECELLGGDLAGLVIHIGARICALADAGEVLVSSTVKDQVAEANIQFSDRGARSLKGVPGEWRLFAAHQVRQQSHHRLTPTPADPLTRPDRLAVGLASRAPGAARTATRLVRLRPTRWGVRRRTSA